MAIDNLRLEFVPWARSKRIKAIPTSLFIVVTDAFFSYLFLYIYFFILSLKMGLPECGPIYDSNCLYQIAYIKVNVFCRCMKLAISYIAKFDGFKFITVLSCFSSVPASLSCFFFFLHYGIEEMLNSRICQITCTS